MKVQSDGPREVAERLAKNTRSFASRQDLDEFVGMLEKLERGEITQDEWKRYRLVRGIYGQRQADTQMIRVKIPQGVLTAAALDRIAEIAERHSRGFGHVTTRQNIQLHFVKLSECATAMAALASVGLTTREACGNSVRNVTACEIAGVCATEPFDVTPYGEAITRAFLRREPFFELPRKFKISLSGCAHDCAQGAIHDVGLIAQVKDGARGFRVLAGGGLSTKPVAAEPLEEFVPVDQILVVIEAILWVFYKHGNRQNKSRARLKYVIVSKGWDFFVDEYRKELAAVRARTGGMIAIDVGVPEAAPPPPKASAAGRAPAAWLSTNAVAQKQPGFSAVTVRLRRGDITAAQMRGVARICETYGDGTARTAAHDQNLVIRWLPTAALGAVYAELLKLGLHDAGAGTIVDTTSCPGADTCQLAYTTSRDLAVELTERLESANGHAAAVAAAADAKIKISGCPNSCGRHHIATIGWHGGVKRVGDGMVPMYQLHLAGGVDATGATFGRQIVKIPARRVSDAVLRLLDLYVDKRTAGESADTFFRRVSDDDVKAALAELAKIDESNVTPQDYVDLGQTKALEVDIGPGECAT